MTKRENEAKYLYVGMFFHAIEAYSKYKEDFSKAMLRTLMATAANVQDDKANFDNGTPRIPSTTYTSPIQSQNDYSSGMPMGKNMGHLLTLFGDVEQKEP